MQLKNYLWEFQRPKLNIISDVKEESEVQAGFTKKIKEFRTTCIGLLCEGIFQIIKTLYLISIDFQKGFDSIKRYN